MDKFWECVQFVCCLTIKERTEESEEMDLEVLDQLPVRVLEVFDSRLADLSYLEDQPLISEDSPWADQMVDKIQSCKSGLRFLRMFFLSLSMLYDAEIRHILIRVSHTHEDMCGRSIFTLLYNSLADRKHVTEKWILDLQGRIQNCKQKFEESCELLLQYSLRCNSFKKELTRDFLDAILENLKDLYKFKTDDEFLLLATLEKKVTLLLNLINDLTPVQWRHFMEMRASKVVVRVFAHSSASLAFTYWVKAVDEEMATRLNLLLQQYKPRVVFKAIYMSFLEEIKLRQLDSLLLGQIIQFILDLLFENLVDILKDDFLVLKKSLIFVISFLAQPPDEHGEDKDWMMTLTAEIEVLVKKDLYLVLPVDDTNGNISEANTCLGDFTRKVELVKGKIQHAYDQVRDSFSYDFPKINGLGFFDFLLQNLGFLREKLERDTHFIHFAKHLIIKIEEELVSLRPYLGDLFDRQKEQKELKDIWLKVIDLAYQTEHAINSCSVTGYPLWYNKTRLMEVLDEIKDVSNKLKKIENRKTHDGTIVALDRAPEGPWASGFNEVMVGLEEEVDIIVEKLTWGSKSLDIVAIVGMAGLGKTTLANKVYNAPAVRNHFHVFAYCIVSQVYSARRILLDILVYIRGKHDEMDDMMEEDLADMLRKCLLGKRYLIIMDDIWDVKVWDEVKTSLPKGQDGSRVIFTTRIRDVATQAKKDCILHHLRFLSDEESWDLLRKKVFRAESCPPDFSQVGMMIAKNCKGLPLTITLIAGLLVRTKRSLSWWKKISETLRSYVTIEGCMDVLELSYQHLPEHLKPCFLYFGAFAEDALIRVGKLMLLWMSEGFVQNSNKENLENVAKEYLCDLVDRSLVIAYDRSSSGGIKHCRVHDLVHEFCQRKAQHENFLQSLDKYEASNSSSSTVRNPYRVYAQTKKKYIYDASKICPSIHTLLFNPKQGYDFPQYPHVRDLKLVQVMDLGESGWEYARFTDEVALLVHLRFIATSVELMSRVSLYPSSIWNLPSFKWNLSNLEILILTGRREFPLELSGIIWNMTRLRHVDVGECFLSSLCVKKGEACPQMVNLESFSSPCISSTKDLEDLLQRLPSLKKLSFQCPDFLSEEVNFPELDSLSKLETLKVSYGMSYGIFFKFPSTIKKLSLSHGNLDRKCLRLISKMPCLEVLKLLRCNFPEDEWEVEDTEFPKLKFLKLERIHVFEWIAYGESFPSLEVLILDRCPFLKTIPPCFGEILTLKSIQVYASREAATSVVEIQEAQKDLGNEELQVIVSDWRTV